MAASTTAPSVPVGHPFDAEIEDERAGWDELPDWSVVVWYALPSWDEPAAWWVAKAGADHYHEHLGRLRSWVATLQRDRNRHQA